MRKIISIILTSLLLLNNDYSSCAEKKVKMKHNRVAPSITLLIKIILPFILSVVLMYALQNSQTKFAHKQIALQSQHFNNTMNLYKQYPMAIQSNVLQQNMQFEQRMFMNNMQFQEQIVQNNLNSIQQNSLMNITLYRPV